MTLPTSWQRLADKFWPVAVLILTPLLIAETVNLWRKNKGGFSKSRS
jgi:hypothetical protein